MTAYEKQITTELTTWKKRMSKKPGFFNSVSKKIQTRVNRLIPEKVHQVMTAGIKAMIRAVLFGSKITTGVKPTEGSLQEIETKVDERIKFYSRTAAAEGAVTGAGGILLGLADFPLWLAVKMKMLFEIASLYGYDVKDYKERVYILYIFELTFSSQSHRRKVFKEMDDWDNHVRSMPEDINEFDWRTFQLEYRDYIDLAKLLQLVPGIGAVVGAAVNLRLTKKLGSYAKNAYRLRGSKRHGFAAD